MKHTVRGFIIGLFVGLIVGAAVIGTAQTWTTPPPGSTIVIPIAPPESIDSRLDKLEARVKHLEDPCDTVHNNGVCLLGLQLNKGVAE